MKEAQAVYYVCFEDAAFLNRFHVDNGGLSWCLV